LSANLETSPDIFNVIKWAGAFYLVYLGYVTITVTFKLPDNHNEEKSPPMRHHSAWRIYCQTILVDLLNPITTPFFLAFISQFIDKISVAIFGSLYSWLSSPSPMHSLSNTA